MEFESVIILGLLAVFVGVLIGSVGIGGVLLVPILTYLFKIEIHSAVSVAMFGYIFTGFAGAIVYGYKGSIDWRMAYWLVLGGMPGAFLGSLLAQQIPEVGLELIIGIFVCFAGFKAFKAHAKSFVIKRDLGKGLLFFLGIIIGLGSAVSGTGGPLLLVPTLVLFNVTSHIAVGLSQAIQLPVAILASLGNYFYGFIDIAVAGILGFGLALGGAIGAHFVHYLPAKTMSKLIAWVLVCVGFFILFKLSAKLLLAWCC